MRSLPTTISRRKKAESMARRIIILCDLERPMAAISEAVRASSEGDWNAKEDEETASRLDTKGATQRSGRKGY
jgi:hypothetical protein